MTPRERLEQAIELARSDPDEKAPRMRCRYCGCDEATAEDRPGLGPILVTGHFARTLTTACTSLRGGEHARNVHEDAWAQLEVWLGRADYGADTDLAVVNADLAAL